ncbi:hypothetical protein Misp02_57540 [Microtetraspora sp. NBRC 16547]|nr:hypothetical protein Misp02_57540 [Microtetraspora sp. NBRC 16547]
MPHPASVAASRTRATERNRHGPETGPDGAVVTALPGVWVAPVRSPARHKGPAAVMTACGVAAPFGQARETPLFRR